MGTLGIGVGAPLNILCVCTYNQTRSVLMAALLDEHLRAEGVRADISGAGTRAAGGAPMSTTVDALAARGIDVRSHRGRPIDGPLVDAADLVITLEDHVLMGGYGSTVLEHFADARIATPVVRIGWPDQFIEHASTVDFLRKKYGLSVENTVAQAKARFAAPVVEQVEFRAA